MKRFLVLGKNGQLASELRYTLGDSAKYIGKELLTSDMSASLEREIEDYKPSVLINCAAYTAVDRAETEKSQCFEANVDLPTRLAKLSNRHEFHLVHFSTDYVFDGSKTSPYLETDLVSPINTYGASKLEGELAIQAHAGSATIVRTSWVYSRFGQNFVKTMLRLARSEANMRVVGDQVGCPTWAGDLADWTLKFFSQSTGSVDLFHFSGEGQTTWHGFAVEVLRQSGINHPIESIATSEFPTPAKRPAYSVLSKEKVRSRFNAVIPFWTDSLAKCLSGWEA